MATTTQPSSLKKQQTGQSIDSAASKQRLIQPEKRPAEPEQRLTIEPMTPSVEPLSPIQTENNAADLVAKKLYPLTLIDKLADVLPNEFPDSHTLKQYLSYIPNSKRLNLSRLLQTLIQCFEESSTTNHYEHGRKLSPGEYHPQPITRNDGRPTGDTQDRPTNSISGEIRSGSNGVAKSESRLEDNSNLDGCSVKMGQVFEKIIDPLSITKDLTSGKQKDKESRDLLRPMPSHTSEPGPHQPVTRNEIIYTPMTSKRSAAAILGTQDSPSKYTATTLVCSSLHNTPTKDRASTPKSTRNSGKEDYWALATQTVSEFANESLQQIEHFSISSNSRYTYKHLLISLRGKDDIITYSDGSEWSDLVETSYKDQQKSSVFYALTAIAFCRWHEGQVQLELQSSGVSPKEAKTKVTGRILQVPAGGADTAARNLRRKSLNLHLTRGRKWYHLVTELSYGILFKNTWALGKADEASLKLLVSSLQSSRPKMLILKHLETQLEMFLAEGRTNPDIKQTFAREKFLDCSLQPLNMSEEVGNLQLSMRDSSPTGRLRIQDSPWAFYIDELDRLNDGQWFGEDSVQLCMNLADKLPYMRVGSPVAIHDEHTGKPLDRPLHWVAKQIEKWTAAVAKANYRLVCFFPLFLENNHFTLLEINQVDNSIYHYDTAGYNTRHIRAACMAQFPNLSYTDQETPRQSDSSSCGPLVVAIARRRMMGRSIESLGHHNAMRLRADAFGLIQKAWQNNILIPELIDDTGSGDDILVSTECFKTTGPGPSEKINLGGEEHSNATDQKDRKRKRAALDIPYRVPTTRSKARRIHQQLTTYSRRH